MKVTQRTERFESDLSDSEPWNIDKPGSLAY